MVVGVATQPWSQLPVCILLPHIPGGCAFLRCGHSCGHADLGETTPGLNHCGVDTPSLVEWAMEIPGATQTGVSLFLWSEAGV